VLVKISKISKFDPRVPSGVGYPENVIFFKSEPIDVYKTCFRDIFGFFKKPGFLDPLTF